MQFAKLPLNIRRNIQMNAGIFVDSFDPVTKTIGNILGATTGDVSFSATHEDIDLFEDVNNAPKNTKEGKILDSWQAVMSGTYVSVTKNLAKQLLGVADIDSDNPNHIVIRNDVLLSDFTEIWWIGDYSDVNTGENAGYMAIHLMNALSTGGFQISAGDKAKGTFSFEYTAHYSTENIDQVPFELYIAEGGSSVNPSIALDRHSATVEEGSTVNLIATTIPSSAVITWTSGDSSIASVSSGGVVTCESEGNTVITASITVDEVTFNDTCTIIVTAAE